MINDLLIDCLIQETGLTAEDFQRLMGLLSFTQLPKTAAGQLEIVNMVSLLKHTRNAVIAL